MEVGLAVSQWLKQHIPEHSREAFSSRETSAVNIGGHTNVILGPEEDAIPALRYQ